MGGTGQLRALRLAPLAVAVGAAVLAFAVLDRLNPAVVMTDDGIRDQLLVRDCTDLDRCHSIGAQTSLPGIYQGAIWLDLLIAVRLLGGDGDTQRLVVVLLLASAVATASAVAWRWLGPPLALPTALLLLAGLSLDRNVGLLINPSAAALPDLLAAASLLAYVRSGGSRFLLAAAFAVGVAINVHVGGASLLPALFVLAVLVAERPVRAAAAVLAVVLAVYVTTSSAALLANLRALAASGRLGWLCGAGLAALLLAAGCRVWFGRRTAAQRMWLTGALLVAPYALGLAWLALSQRHPFTVAYLHPVLAQAAAMAAALLCHPFERAAGRWPTIRWWPSGALVAAAAAVAVFLWLPQPRGRATTQQWSLAEGARVAVAAGRMGWSHEDLRLRLQSGDCHDLLTAMSTRSAPPSLTPIAGPRQLQVVKMRTKDMRKLTASHEAVWLPNEEVAVLREIDSWMRPSAVQACRRPAGSDTAQCAAVDLSADERDPQRFLFSSRSYPDVHRIDVSPPYTASYQIPVLPEEGGRRQLMLTADAAAAGWRITNIEGVQFEGALPAARVGLYSDNGHPGMIVVERRFDSLSGADDVDVRTPPCLFESPSDDLLTAAVAPR